MNNRITILFPGIADKPIGGYKILLQYANELAELGYQINVVYSCYFPIPISKIRSCLRFVKYLFRHIATRILRNYSCKQWFTLKRGIKETYVWSLYTSSIPEADYYFATAAVTAKSLNRFNVPANRKFYFVQSYEPWYFGDEGLFETFRINCRKICISKWLKEIVDNHSDQTTYIPNGFNPQDYHLSIPIQKKSPYIVSILYHEWKDKGFVYGFEALQLVKKEIPELQVKVFGVFDKPDYFPEWFTYYQNPGKELHNRINNESAIYLATSTMEGYGLTIGEAMLCGQAVVCTNNPGYLEMAVDNVNALVCPVQDSEALANAVIRLIKDDELRMSLARKGYETIQEFTIEKSLTKLVALLK